MRALRSALPLLLAAACATPTAELMSADEAFLDAPAPEAPAGAPPSLSGEPPEASSTHELRSRLAVFARRARLHREQVARGSPMPSLEVTNWLELTAALDAFLLCSARETPSSDVVRARLTVESELALDARTYGEMPPDMADGVLARIARLATRMAEVRKRFGQDRVAPRPGFVWPVDPVSVTSVFGRRLHPIDKVYRQHLGVDLAASEGQAVSAAGNGVVVRAGWSEGHGNSVEVDHGGGTLTRYSHLSEILVERGLKIKRGDVLGLAGTTGLSTGVHLHFEFWRDGQARNPLEELGQPAAEPVATR